MRLLFILAIFISSPALAQHPREIWEQAREEFDDELTDAFFRLFTVSKSCPGATVVAWADYLVGEYVAAKKIDKRREMMRILLTGEKEELGKIRRLSGPQLDQAYCRHLRNVFDKLHMERGIRLVDWR